MPSPEQDQPFKRQPLAWMCAAMAGLAGPAAAMLLLVDGSASAPPALVSGPILAVALMGAGMIGAAIAARLSVGLGLALSAGTGLVVLARALGMPPLFSPVFMALAFGIASLSFAARGALFARSAQARGWWIAVFVVAGEAAVVLTAYARPGALPEWLLALLPAQWASMAIESALTGTASPGAIAALVALAGTAAATLLVARLWPRRWPYAIMFSAWLGLSALVYHQP